MRDFLLVVPDLVFATAGADAGGDVPDADPGGAGAAAVADLRQRFGAAQPLPRGWRAWLASTLGRPDLEALAPAAVVADALPASEATPPGRGRDRPAPWLATPLHLVAGMDTVHLPRDGILQLEADELAELAASFDADLGGGALRLRAAAPDAFVLEGLDIEPVAVVEPLDCLGGDLRRAQPTGAGAAPLRRLMAEIEMWLHGHPLNQRRAARGALAVRSLWLWGANAAERPAPRRDAGSEAGGVHHGGADAGDAASLVADADAIGALRVHSDDAWVRAAARLARVSLAPEGDWPAAAAFDGRPGTLVATARLHGAAAGDRALFERRHLAPALAALRAGRLAGVSIAGADRAVRLEARDRWRVWRPRRTWLGALGA